MQNQTYKPSDNFTLDEVSFRKFKGEQDYPLMLAIIEGSKQVDDIQRTDTMDDIRNNYTHLTNSDPYQDMIFVDIKQHTVGYSRVWWYDVIDGPLLYSHFAFLLPEWRGLGIRQAMVEKNEQQLHNIARKHDATREKYYEAWATDSEKDWIGILEKKGYKTIRYGFDMVRPDLDDIPECSLPDGLEIRPVRDDEVDLIWEAGVEAFRDHWNFSEDEWGIEQLRSWQKDPTYNPSIWKVAWDGSQVAGMVLNFINENENKEYNRKRGYTEMICVRRPWRRRGLARALIAESLKTHKVLGMTETAHGVDAENPHGALKLYESMGYIAVKTSILYRKALQSTHQRTHNNDHTA